MPDEQLEQHGQFALLLDVLTVFQQLRVDLGGDLDALTLGHQSGERAFGRLFEGQETHDLLQLGHESRVALDFGEHLVTGIEKGLFDLVGLDSLDELLELELDEESALEDIWTESRDPEDGLVDAALVDQLFHLDALVHEGDVEV